MSRRQLPKITAFYTANPKYHPRNFGCSRWHLRAAPMARGLSGYCDLKPPTSTALDISLHSLTAFFPALVRMVRRLLRHSFSIKAISEPACVPRVMAETDALIAVVTLRINLHCFGG